MALKEHMPKAFNRKKGLLNFYAEKKMFVKDQSPENSCGTPDLTKSTIKIPRTIEKISETHLKKSIRLSKSVPRTLKNYTMLTTLRRNRKRENELSPLKMSGEKQTCREQKPAKLKQLLKGLIIMRSRELLKSAKKESPMKKTINV